MFPGFSHVWSPLALSSSRRGRGPFPFVVAGERIAVFRDEEGRLGAVLDACPHRGASLAGGRVHGSCVVCPLHGWEITTAGDVSHVPFNPRAKRERLRAVALPIVERHGIIWVQTRPLHLLLDGTADEAPTEPSVPAEMAREDVRLTVNEAIVNVHWTRAVENFLDDAHLPFVHASTIGRGVLRHRDDEMDLSFVEHPWGFAWTTSINGVAQTYAAEFRWPNALLLRVPAGDGLLAVYLAAIPLVGNTTRLLQIGVRGFLRSPLLDWVFRAVNRRVLDEDRAVLEASPRGEVPPPHAEPSVSTDAASLRFRKRYRRELCPGGRRLPMRATTSPDDVAWTLTAPELP